MKVSYRVVAKPDNTFGKLRVGDLFTIPYNGKRSEVCMKVGDVVGMRAAVYQGTGEVWYPADDLDVNKVDMTKVELSIW